MAEETLSGNALMQHPNCERVTTFRYYRGEQGVRKEDVEGLAFKDFVLFNDPGAGWRIIHKNTGRAVGRHFLFNRCLEYVRYITPFAEWRSVDGPLKKESELYGRMLNAAKIFGVMDV